jgi:hypothetical protein
MKDDCQDGDTCPSTEGASLFLEQAAAFGSYIKLSG